MRKMAFLFIMLSGFANAVPTAQPVPKSGSCPSGYYNSGSYCVPSGNQSRFAIQKKGSCPTGYYNSGDYCVASSENSKMVIPKVGSCPTGYYNSGDYCVSTQ